MEQRLQVVELTVEIEVLLPGVPMFHVKRYAGFPDLYLARDGRGGRQCITPVRGIHGDWRLRAWHGDFPPVAELIEQAYPELCEVAA